MCSLVIANDHPLFRRGLRDVIEEDGSVRVVAEVGDGRAALEALRTLRPALAVIDIAMPELDGLELLRAVRRWHERPAIVMLTMYDDHWEQAFDLGAPGYLLKESAVDEVMSCLEAVASGRRFASEGLSAGASDQGSLAMLTAAERRVLKLIGELKTSREIAALLSVSHRTVQNHRQNACRKLGLSGSQALLRFALDHGQQPWMLEPPPGRRARAARASQSA
jgi:DNA-binding NarL/FixJ family response regulator